MSEAKHRTTGTQTFEECPTCKHRHCELQERIEETARREHERWLLWHLAP